MASSKLIIRPVSRVVATAGAVEVPAVGVAHSGMAKVEATLSALALASTHPPIHFLSFLGPHFAEKENPCTYCSFYSNAKI